MLLRIQKVNYNDLHDRETHIVFSGDEPRSMRINYALVVYRQRENVGKTPYVCYYMGLSAEEFETAKQMPDSIADEFSFLGIPNDCISVSHDVLEVFLAPRPAAFIGIDQTEHSQESFESFVSLALKIKGIKAWPLSDPSSSSSKMSLVSPMATKESFAESADQLG